MAESFVEMMGRIHDQLELWLDTQVADFHFKPIEIYHEWGDQTKMVIITKEAKGRFYVVVARVQLVGRVVHFYLSSFLLLLFPLSRK